MFKLLKGMAHNIGESFNVGFRAGLGGSGGAMKSAIHNDIGSIGGLSTIGGLATAGAGVGALYGSISNSSHSHGEDAAVAAAIRAGALPAAGLSVAAGYHVIKNLDKIGTASFSAVLGTAIAGRNLFGDLNSVNRLANPLGHYANQATKRFKGLVDYTPSKTVWNKAAGQFETTSAKMSLSKWGYGIMFAGGIAMGAGKALDAFESSRMGTMDGNVTTATPRIPSYQDNAGTSGDLVFALNANRRG